MKLTTHLSTPWRCRSANMAHSAFHPRGPWGWKAELAMLADLQRTHINGYPSAAGPVQTSEGSPIRDRRSTTEPPNQLPRLAVKAYKVGFLHAGGGIPCRPHPTATQLVLLGPPPCRVFVLCHLSSCWWLCLSNKRSRFFCIASHLESQELPSICSFMVRVSAA